MCMFFVTIATHFLVVNNIHMHMYRIKIMENSELLTKEQLRQRLNVPHVRIIEEMTRKRKLPVVSLGYRTKRYSWPAVLKALEKLTVKEMGA